MSDAVKHAETRECPSEYQARLTRSFGVNQFGDPNIKIVWGQSQFIRMGNIWRDRFGNERAGYRERYQVAGQPCWCIMRWKPPTTYGSPAMYYVNTYLPTRQFIDNPVRKFDSIDGYYVTGEYPWRGRYEPMYTLISKEFVNGKLEITHFPLSHYLIDTLLPMIFAFQRLSKQEQQAAKEAARAAEERAQTESIADMLEEKLPSFWGPVSFNGQGCRTSLLDRKMAQIQQAWDRMAKGRLKPLFTKGIVQGDRPRISRYTN